MDWDARFGRRSPLSRKIITFNLVALGVLLTGVLYLSQFQSGILEQRARGMLTEARLIGTILSDELAAMNGDTLTSDTALAAFGTIRTVTTSRMLLFDAEGRLISRVEPTASEPVAQPLPGEEEVKPSAFIAIMSGAWDRLSRVFAARRAPDIAPINAGTARPLAQEALESGVFVQVAGTTQDGDQIISVAVPVVVAEEVVGALVLATRPGDIDELIRDEREQILQVFALAIICSIFLSLVLANTIVRPLRDLSEAAHEGGMRSNRQLNPERINIPDMTARPDEIGYLSGAMRLMTTALFERIEANESFAADVAHEIKNPLTSLRSAVDTMPYAKSEENREKLLTVIRNDVGRLDRIVTDISNASRLDSELVRDRMEPFDLHQLLTNLIEYNVDQAAKVGAKLEARMSGPYTITGLEGRLAQVFVNLITNAISFASDGDVIRISTEVGPRAVRVLVEDDGPGIPDDNLADVFERFYSERPVQEEFGNHSGLGLAISRQIVEAHGGTIWAENIRPDGAGLDVSPDGARFVVELPV